MNKVVLTGIKPTGIPHIGNYFGAIRPAIEMSNNPEYDGYFFIADYHALNFIKDPNELKELTKLVACTWLACGLDPKKVVFYRQSSVPEVTELNWILNNVTSKGLMNRAHAYKASVDRAISEGKDPDFYVNMGLYCYPILMAADILLYNTKLVPVGLDQKQHVEMARDIAKSFNKTFGYTFVVPSELISEDVAVVPGIDGSNKMSKSHGNVIPLFCSEEELKKYIMSIKTDSTPVGDPKSVECTLFKLYRLFATEQECMKMAAKYQAGIGWAEAKNELFIAANNYLKPMREKYNYYMSHYDEVLAILEAGEKKARKVAKETLQRARTAIGL